MNAQLDHLLPKELTELLNRSAVVAALSLPRKVGEPELEERWKPVAVYSLQSQKHNSIQLLTECRKPYYYYLHRHTSPVISHGRTGGVQLSWYLAGEV